MDKGFTQTGFTEHQRAQSGIQSQMFSAVSLYLRRLLLSWKSVVLRRTAHIGIYQQNSISSFRKCDSKIRGDRAFPLPRASHL